MVSASAGEDGKKAVAGLRGSTAPPAEARTLTLSSNDCTSDRIAPDGERAGLDRGVGVTPRSAGAPLQPS